MGKHLYELYIIKINILSQLEETNLCWVHTLTRNPLLTHTHGSSSRTMFLQILKIILIVNVILIEQFIAPGAVQKQVLKSI